MKYFKITDLATREEHYVSSTASSESAEHLLTSSGLDLTKKFRIEEVRGAEFYGLSTGRPDPDTDDEVEDSDDDYY